MSTENPLKDWERPYFSQPVEQNLLYFVVYSKELGEFQISGEKYRIYHMPEGLNLSSYSLEEQPDMLNQFREGLFANILQEQIPELVESVKALEHCYIVQAVLPDKPDLNDLRSVIGLVGFLLDTGAVAAFDALTFQWWSPEQWHEKVLASEEFDAFAHVSMLITPEHNESEWIHTRGMRKFGRPDLSIHHVTEEEVDAVEEMINRFISFMAAGGVITEGQEVRMDTLPEGMICHHKGNMADPDFNNTHVEITWPDPDAQ